MSAPSWVPKSWTMSEKKTAKPDHYAEGYGHGYKHSRVDLLNFLIRENYLTEEQVEEVGRRLERRRNRV